MTATRLIIDPVRSAEALIDREAAGDFASNFEERHRAREVLNAAAERELLDDPEEDMALILFKVKHGPLDVYTVTVCCPFCRLRQAITFAEIEDVRDALAPLILPAPCRPLGSSWRYKVIARPTARQRLSRLGVYVPPHTNLATWPNTMPAIKSR